MPSERKLKDKNANFAVYSVFILGGTVLLAALLIFFFLFWHPVPETEIPGEPWPANLKPLNQTQPQIRFTHLGTL